MFCQMIAQLYELSEFALPTSFHHLLRALDDRGRLLRVYTQNIDALERKCGLTFGVPEQDIKRYKPRSSKGKSDSPDESGPSIAIDPPQIRLPTPPIETPKCIPLHGTVQLMHCQICTHSFPLKDHLSALSAGKPPYCPECTALEETRQLIGKRSRGVGKLRPSVVLYNEMHKDGEEVGDVVRRDLIGSSKGKGRAGADLLLVVGTSLRVPGTKRIVREFSKAVHSRSSPASTSQNEPSSSVMGLATPTPSPRRSPAGDEDPPIKVVYLNLDFPVPTREWEGVFDVWIRGDAQAFAQIVHDEMEREEKAKEAASERKRRREEAALAAQLEENVQEGQPKPAKKRKGAPGSQAQLPSTKKRKAAPLTPVSISKPRPAKAKKGDGKTLPVHNKTKARNTSKGKLTIKIPPRPEVLITTAPKGMKWRPTTPSDSPPDSPLTPTSSPALRSSKPSTPMSANCKALSQKSTRPAHGPHKADRDADWDDRDSLTDLSDEETDDYPSYLPTVSYSVSHRPGG